MLLRRIILLGAMTMTIAATTASAADPGGIFDALRSSPPPAPAPPPVEAMEPSAPPPAARPAGLRLEDFIAAPEPPRRAAPPPKRKAAEVAAPPPPTPTPTLRPMTERQVAAVQPTALFHDPSSDSRRIGRVFVGQRLTATASGDGWVRVTTAGGLTGHLPADAVTEAQTAPAVDTAAQTPAATERPGDAVAAEERLGAPERQVAIRETAVVFASPSTEARRAGRVSVGQTVTATDIDGDWVRIRTVAGVTGWVRKEVTQ